MLQRLFISLFMMLLVVVTTLNAESIHNVTQVCPAGGIQARSAGFTPGGIILTSFDKTNLWVYNIDRDTRYPLPDTRPCGVNCRLSPDAKWVTYIDPLNNSYGKMRLDGTERTLLTEYATDIEWWPDNRLLIWTPGHHAYWQVEGTLERQFIDVQGIASVQPGGAWGLEIHQEGDGFTRSLLNLETRGLQGIAEQRVALGEDTVYLNTAAWSPDGSRLALVAPNQFDNNANVAGGEIFIIRPGETTLEQITDLNSIYGAVRINGRASNDLSWSPDSTRIAFWVIELLGSNVESDTGNAIIHVLDITTGEVQAFCSFTTTEHTPNTPRLVWSPDGTHLAFGANVPGDDKGYLVLALDTATGVFTELSNGIYPALGRADVVAWGLLPNQ
jgi:WD40 repeat protein